MKNKIFQSIWFIMRGIWPRRKGKDDFMQMTFPVEQHLRYGVNLDQYSARMLAGLKIASWFGEIGFIIIGDSNGEGLNKIRKMSKFKPISLNIAIGGTTATDWNWFLEETKSGDKIKELIQKSSAKVLLNIGGNHALKNEMATAHTQLTRLKKHFPKSYIMNIPPVRDDIFQAIGVKNMARNTGILNGFFMGIWADHVIDVFGPFKEWYDDNRATYLLIIGDMVHFTDQADRLVRIPLIKQVMKV